ncbi:MAG: preprotein translocase subunit SecY [Clostridia bacterium]|nr:preprotein translocase subunit SecY [Clostridia bacterium]
MFSILKNAWKIPDLRKKILYTVLLLIVFRLGAHIPVPFANPGALDYYLSGDNTLFGLANIMSGNALQQFTIFAMGITPYINSSIIMQLLTVAIPALERMSKEGEEGKKKIAKLTRIVTIVLAFVQGAGLYMMVVSPDMQSATTFFTVVLTLTAGTAFLMWLGEQINEKGVGNGISLIIFAGIISGAPSAIAGFIYGDTNWIIFALVVLVILITIGFIVLMNNAERRIPVQYAKRVVGRKMYGGQSTHVPIKVAMAGVMPIIFAVSIMAFPATIAQMLGGAQSGFWAGVIRVFSPGSAWYSIIYFVLIILFTYFYTEIQFNPVEIANNMKNNGGFVPGLRPGKPTSDFIRMVLNRITLIGAVFIALIAVAPTLLSHFDSAFAFGGSSLIIVVGVAIETVKQIESQMLMRHYKGFLE